MVLEKLEADIERIAAETEADEQLLRLIIALDCSAPIPTLRGVALQESGAWRGGALLRFR